MKLNSVFPKENINSFVLFTDTSTSATIQIGYIVAFYGKDSCINGTQYNVACGSSCQKISLLLLQEGIKRTLL